MQSSFSAAHWAFQLGGMLILVIALILALAWMSRRLGNPSMGGIRRIKVIDTLMLGRSERISLVQIGEKYQLLGISGSGINLLGQFDDLPAAVSTTTDTPFSKLFSQARDSIKPEAQKQQAAKDNSNPFSTVRTS